MANQFSFPSNNPKDVYREWLSPARVIPQSRTKKILAKKFLIAFLIVAVVMGFCLALASLFTGVAESAAVSRNEWKMSGKVVEDDPVAWLKDIEAYKQMRSKNLLAVSASIQKSAVVNPDKVNGHEKELPPKMPRVRQAKVQPSQPSVDHADPWSQVYGGSSRNKNVPNTFASSGQSLPSGKNAPGSNSAVGSKLAVKLKGSAASNPSGPVIAVLTRTTSLGGQDLPRGTEIHGETRGAGAGARLIMSFDYIRPPSGDVIRISGRAVSRDGRIGVVGTQSLGGGSDIAASVIGTAIQTTGNLVSSFAGSKLGSAIDSAVSPTVGKSRRLDYSEEVVLLNNGSHFDIYIDSIDS